MFIIIIINIFIDFLYAFFFQKVFFHYLITYLTTIFNRIIQKAWIESILKLWEFNWMKAMLED